MAEITGEPIGYVVALRFSDGTYDPDSPDCAGMWPTPERAAEDAADPEMTARLVNGQQWVVCGLVPIEDGQHG